MSHATPRPRRWWIAFLLNALFPPIGYAYVGAWMMVAGTVVGVIAGAVALNEWTLDQPPGVYGLGQSGMMGGSLVVLTLLGAHAAWMARRAPAKTGSPGRHAALYIAPWLFLFGANALYGAYGPHPTYVMSSSHMSPGLQPDDIVIVEGARAACGADVQAGDVVVFRRPNVAEPMTHRIVAGPGQTVGMAGGRLVIDGKPVAREPKGSVALDGVAGRATEFQETLPNGATYRTYDLGPNAALDNLPARTVPAGSWYLMGDNRDNAQDSRVFGPVAGKDICAVALKIVSAKDKRRVGQRP